MSKLISITGKLGSGKSTVTKQLCELWQCNKYSTGDAQRQLAQQRGITTLELNLISETDKSIDQEIDSMFGRIGDSKEDLIVDSRMAWFFLPRSLKIKLTVQGFEAARRVLHDLERSSENRSTIEETYQNLKARRESERRRFIQTYGVDIEDERNFDLVIDTTDASPQAVVGLINNQADRYFSWAPIHKFWASPKSMFPTGTAPDLSDAEGQELIDSIRDEGFNEQFPITLAGNENGFFIFDGHRRASAALLAQNDFVPVNFLGHTDISFRQNPAEFIDDKFKMELVAPWEKTHNFQFSHSPLRNLVPS